MARWIDPTIQQQVDYRPGDTIISVPGKSGTTWTMNIFHQLRTGGDANFEDIYVEVPWLEYRERPDQTNDELLERWNAMPADVPRGFKSHAKPGDPAKGGFLPFKEDINYIVVVRNPQEAIASFFPFFKAHTTEFLDYWGATELFQDWALNKTDFETFFYEGVLTNIPGMPPDKIPPGGLMTMVFFSFVNAWWPLRHKSNVLMLHFNDMKQDHEGTVRKIAEFLGKSPTEEEFSNICEYSSFTWMKQHQDKFEMTRVGGSRDNPIRVLREGGMVRKGQIGQSDKDGVTPKVVEDIQKYAKQMVPDDAARKWMFEGGPYE